MLKDFLSVFRCCDLREAGDLCSVCAELTAGEAFISYVPSITLDLWPMYVLQTTPAKRYSHPTECAMVYLVPIGAVNFWAKSEFQNLALNFYRNDEFPNGRNTYGFSLEEMLLLQYPGAVETLELAELGSANAIYMRLSRDNTADVHILILLENPSEGWKTIVERYDIPLNMLVDSHKGLGNWFEDVPLYSYMTTTDKPQLLPRYYFKGKYISHGAPEGFESLMPIAESSVRECTSEIFRTSW